MALDQMKANPAPTNSAETACVLRARMGRKSFSGSTGFERDGSVGKARKGRELTPEQERGEKRMTGPLFSFV